MITRYRYNIKLKNSVKIIEKSFLNYKHKNKIKYDSIINWTMKNHYKKYKKAFSIEKFWGNHIVGLKNNKHWTTKLGEYIVKRVLYNKGYYVWNPILKNRYKPDLETKNFIYEVKTRSWNIRGSVGEKVLGTPYKYSDIPRIYNKPLRIICVANQEYELYNGNYNVFGENISDEKKDMLKYWSNKKIFFIPFSHLLDEKILKKF